MEGNQKKGRDNDCGKCRANLRSRHLKDSGTQAQGCEVTRWCKEAAPGQKRKENNIIWSGLRWGVMQWKNTAKATFPLLFWLSSGSPQRMLQFKTLNISCKMDITVGNRKTKHKDWGGRIRTKIHRGLAFVSLNTQPQPQLRQAASEAIISEAIHGPFYY